MKKWILGLILLVSFEAFGQPSNYVPLRTRQRLIAGMFDSTLHVPRFNGSPSLRTGGSTNDGAIAIDTANGVFYFYHNSSWKRANLDTSAAFITSVYRKTASDSVFYVKGGTHTFAFIDSIGTAGGGDYPAVPNPDNPNNWIVIQDKRNPIFSVENMGGVVALESSMYAPSPISINDTLFRVYAKGDATNSIHYWESRDSMRTWSYIDTAIYPTPSPTWDSVDIAFPHAVYDPVGDTIHIYYTGGKGTGGPDYGIGHIAIKSNATHPLTRPSTPFISNATAATLLGESVGFIDLSSMVKKDGEHYWFGSYSHGDSVFLFAAKGPDWRNVDSMWRIMSPYTPMGYNGIINPTVYKRGDLYYGIFADSRVDADFIRDTSKSMLASMYSTNLISWTRLPNFFMQPRGDTSWNGKQVYDMQFLKVNGDNYDELYKLKRDTLWGGPLKDQNEGFYYGFVSGSYFGCCLDQSGIIYVLPQEDDYMNFAVTDYPVRNDISFYQRNNTLALNIPVATSQVSGKLSNTDWTTFNNKAPASGSANYINNQFSTPQDASFNIDSVGYIGRKLTVGGTNADYVMNVDGYLNSGNVLNLRNASNFGINQLTQVSTEITQLWNGAGEGYLNMFTSGGAINERFYKKNYQPVYSPFSAFLIMYGKQTDATRVEINGGNPSGFGLSRTANGTALAVNQADGYNTTSGALTSYGIVSNNTSTRESGSNALTNYAGRFVSSGGQNNYSISLGNPALYEANYGSLFSARTLVDKGYVDSLVATVGGGSSFVDSVSLNAGGDSLIVYKLGTRYAYELPSGSSSGWGLSGNSITANVDFLGTTNNTSLRLRTNNTQRAIFDSLGNLHLGLTANPIYANTKFYIRRPDGSSSNYSIWVEDAFFSASFYVRNDGLVYSSSEMRSNVAGTASNSVVTNAGTQTLTNKRITKRVGTTASTSSLTIDSDSYDMYTVTALAAGITINNPSGTPTSGQTLIIRLEDDGTGRSINYGANFRAIGVTLPTTTVAGKTIYLGCIWNSTDSKWDVVSVNEEA